MFNNILSNSKAVYYSLNTEVPPSSQKSFCLYRSLFIHRKLAVAF